MNIAQLKFTVFFAMAMSLLAGSGMQPVIADEIEPPAVFLEGVTEKVIQTLRDDYDLLQKEPERVYKIIDEKILPHLDDVTMAKLAMGKHWRNASNEQKRVFVDEFRNLLVRTYSKSLLEFKDQEIRYFPAEAEGERTMVKAEVIQPGGPSIPLAYRMRVKDNAWKVYDIHIDGISLVTSYRGTFTQEIRKSGIDGLLKYLQDQNSKLST